MPTAIEELLPRPVTAKPAHTFDVFKSLVAGDLNPEIDQDYCGHVSALHTAPDGHTYRITVEVAK